MKLNCECEMGGRDGEIVREVVGIEVELAAA